ncbi:MAG: hypothetical protein RLZZ401_1217 [Pseudomonadota bacterium]
MNNFLFTLSITPTFKIRFHFLWPTVLVLLLGMATTLIVWRGAALDAQALAMAKLESRSNEIQKSIQDRMNAYEQILRGGAGLIASMPQVTRERWASYVRYIDIEKNYRGVQGIGYAAYVPADARDAFVDAMREGGFAGYTIRPPGERTEYAPVSYLEPRTERNLRAHGFDMWSEPTRRDAMQRSRDSGKPAVTSRLKLASEPDASAAFGFLLYVPVYDINLPLDTVAQRRAALRGFVNSPFRFDDLLRGVLGTSDEAIGLTLYDGLTEAPDTQLLEARSVAGRGPSEGPGAMPSVRVKTTAMAVHDHHWTLAFSAPSIVDPHDLAATRWMLVSGLTISALLGALTFALSKRVLMIRTSEQHYFRLANFDSLTGLPNRAMFQDRLQRSVLQAGQEGRSFALLFIDVDHFKDVNDSLGHQVGDILLQALASRLQASVHEGDMVARLGGDEFTIILSDLSDNDSAGRWAQTLLDQLKEPIDLPGKSLSTAVSIGVTIYPDDGTQTSDLLRNADQAMYAAKRLGRNQYQYFNASPQDNRGGAPSAAAEYSANSSRRHRERPPL